MFLQVQVKASHFIVAAFFACCSLCLVVCAALPRVHAVSSCLRALLVWEGEPAAGGLLLFFEHQSYSEHASAMMRAEGTADPISVLILLVKKWPSHVHSVQHNKCDPPCLVQINFPIFDRTFAPRPALTTGCQDQVSSVQLVLQSPKRSGYVELLNRRFPRPLDDTQSLVSVSTALYPPWTP